MGEATPVRVIVLSKQGDCSIKQVPAPWFAHSLSMVQLRKVFSEHVPRVLSWQRSSSSLPQNPSAQELAFFCCALLACVPGPFTQVLLTSEHSASPKQGWSGSPSGTAAEVQKPQWQKNPQVDLGWLSGPELQSESWLHAEKGSCVHTPFRLNGGAHSSWAVRLSVRVVTLGKMIARPCAETLVVESGGQSNDTPPNLGLKPPTVQVSPLLGPPWQVNTMPGCGFWASVPQRGQGWSFAEPRCTRLRNLAVASPWPVLGLAVPTMSSEK